MDKKRDIKKISIERLTTKEMRTYYKGNKKINSLLDGLAGARAAMKKTTDQKAQKEMSDQIKDIKADIRREQFEHYKKLPKKSVVLLGTQMRSGLIKEHPSGGIFQLLPEIPIRLPVHQAKQLIAEVLVSEVK